MKFTPNLVVGVIITLVGSVLVLDRLGLVEFEQALRLWPVMLTLFGVSVIAQALSSDRDGVPAESRRPIVGPGLVLFVAVVSVLSWKIGERRSLAGAGTDTGMSLVGVLGEDVRTSDSPAFRGAEMLSVMGGTKLDLRGATLGPGQEASIRVFGLMGGVEITVPRGWEIDVKTVAIMGGVNDQRPKKASKPANGDEATEPEPPVALNPAGGPTSGVGPVAPPRLVIHGFVVMGGLVVKS